MLLPLRWSFYADAGDTPVVSVTTTTYCGVRDQIIATLIAATPNLLPQYRFDLAPRNYGAARFASETGSASLRRFDIRRGSADLTSHDDANEVERAEVFTLTMTYPVMPGLYGRGGLDELDRVMRRDAAQVRDLITSQGNHVTGQRLAFVKMLAPERSSTVWTQRLEILAQFAEAESLT